MIKQNKPLVSIIITTRNRSQILKRAINSALNQTYENIEIIIIDDASTDNTYEIIKTYLLNNNNIKYIRNKQCLGANISRNEGIKIAKGEFIAGLDDDDEFLPDRIRLLMRSYSSKYSMITSRNIEITSNNTKIFTKYIPIIDINAMYLYNAIGNQVLINKNHLVKLGGFDPTLIRSQDYDMWTRVIDEYGPARMIFNPTQVIYSNHNFGFRANYKFNSKGLFQFYKKNKHKMNRFQKNIFLYNIKRNQNKIKKNFLYSTWINLYLLFNLLKFLLKNKML